MERIAAWGPVSRVALALEDPVRLLRLPPWLLDGWTWHTAVRADDLVVLEIGRRRLDRVARDAAPPLLVGRAEGSLLSVAFAPQHVEEQAIFEPADTEPTVAPGEWTGGKPDAATTLTVPAADTVSRAWMSAPSRLVFQVPVGFEIVLTLEGVLDAMARLDLNLHPGGRSPRTDPRAVINRGPVRVRRIPLREPTDEETAIELPRRLVLTPNRTAGWVHETAARALGPARAHELWHTRLGVRQAGGTVSEEPDERRSVRAVWARAGAPSWVPSPRYGEPTEPQPQPDDDPAIPIPVARVPVDEQGRRILVPLDAADRWELVHLTGEHVHVRGYRGQPAGVERLQLSALGGWLDLHGHWPDNTFGSISEWRHRATLGRDHLVRVVYEGVLLPWGHRAALIKVSERRFHDDLEGSPAFVRQRLFIVVRQPELRPPAAAGQTWERTLPFTKLQMRTLITPPLDFVGEGVNHRRRNLFVPKVGTKAFQFALRGFKLHGGHVDWHGPAVMVLYPFAEQPGPVGEALMAYVAEQGAAGLGFGGARVPVAPIGRDDDTVLPLDAVKFSAEIVDGAAYAELKKVADRMPGDVKEPAPSVLKFDEMQAQVPVAKHFAGRGESPWLAFHQTYVEHGFAPGENAVGAFARAAGAPLALDFAKRGDKTGGLVQPSFKLKGLTRELGPVSGLTSLDKLCRDGVFDPKDFFGDGLDPLLFGVLRLSDLVDAAGLGEGLEKMPRFLSEAPSVDELTLRFSWQPKLRELGPFVPSREGGGPASLSVQVSGKVKATGDAAFDVETKLDDFTLDLIRGIARFLELRFEKLHFIAHAGQKPDVVVDLAEVRFVGVLSFVEALRSLIPLDGFADPPALTVDEQGVRASFSLALPDISFGVFSLRNLGLGAGFVVPFVATPLTVRFSFCERSAPFLLTVSAFGGGGFLTICVDPDGVQALEAGFEFGASLAMDFGVASGEVHVLGGFVYAMVKDKASLTGYLRIGGSVEALGIVTVSIELTLSLKYEFSSGKCIGKATLEIEIEIAFFSVSVEIECERRFAGSNGDPPFAWMWGPTAELPAHIHEDGAADPWAAYCGAFAGVA